MSRSWLLACSAILAAVPARRHAAEAVLLDFEGVGNDKPVGSFYGDVGIVFGPSALGEITSVVTNVPSPNTTLLLYGLKNEASKAYVTVLGGGFTALSFQYTSYTDVDVTVYDGPNMTGNVLGATALSTAGLCSDEVCGVWRNAAVPFSGAAKSAGFSSDEFFLFVDDLVIDLAQPTKRPRKRPTKSPVCRTRRKGNLKRCRK
jgi:hypothetical protein